MARPRKKSNRRKKGRRPLLVALLVAGIVVLVALWFLGKVTTKPEQATRKTPAAEHQKIPPRLEEKPAIQGQVSAARRPSPARPPTANLEAKGTVAIIIDDMGTSVNEVATLTAIGVPLSFAIIPGLAKVREVAEAVHEKKSQVLIHMPMEPQGYPQQRLEKNGLLLAQSDAEVTERVRAFFRAIPYAIGANNHMGSRFTENENKMRLVLGLLKEQGLFFIDSKTSPRSVGYPLARGMGLATASRDVFLDNEQSVEAICAQLQVLALKARKQGAAIGICHPHRATMEALATGLPALQKEGIRFVFVSELVK